MSQPVSATADFISGNFGGMANVLVGQPLDTIKVRLQLDSTRFKGAWDCAVQMAEKEGFLSLYKGMASPLVGIGAVNALLFASNSAIKKQLSVNDEILPYHKIAIAGAGAGVINSVLASPVELLKIKLQAHSTRFTGPIDCATFLIRRDGVRGLFRGLWATVVREIPAYAGFYTGFEVVKRHWTQGGREATVVELMTAGAVGGIGYWVFCYPLDVVKSMVQNQTEAPKGFYVIQVLKQIYARDQFRGLFRGITPTILRSIPAAAATFTAYELSLRAFQANGW